MTRSEPRTCASNQASDLEFGIWITGSGDVKFEIALESQNANNSTGTRSVNDACIVSKKVR
jgi:hypothetical protein